MTQFHICIGPVVDLFLHQFRVVLRCTTLSMRLQFVGPYEALGHVCLLTIVVRAPRCVFKGSSEPSVVNIRTRDIRSCDIENLFTIKYLSSSAT